METRQKYVAAVVLLLASLLAGVPAAAADGDELLVLDCESSCQVERRTLDFSLVPGSTTPGRAATWLPDGDRLVLSDGDGDTQLVDTTDDGRTPLGGRLLDPIEPDAQGTRVAATSRLRADDGSRLVEVVDVTTGTATSIPTTHATAEVVGWSGDRVVWLWSNPDGTGSDIFGLDWAAADGTDVEELYRTEFVIADADVRPDGDVVLSNGGLRILDVDSGRLRFVDGVTTLDLEVSPAGDRVARVAADDDRIDVVLLDGGTATTIGTADGRRSFRPVWSPTGDVVAWTAFRGAPDDLGPAGSIARHAPSDGSAQPSTSDVVGSPLGFRPTPGAIPDEQCTPRDVFDASQRHAGDDRIGTATVISRRFFATADTVLLARADAYPDALAGAPLARALEAPILLTSRDELDGRVAEELFRLETETVVLLGGPGALSDRVETSLRLSGFTTRRIAGEDRFATAALVADELPPNDTAWIVEGRNDDPGRGWPDAVSAAPVAAAGGEPVLTVTRDALPSPTAAALRDRDVRRVWIVGGEAAVSADVEQDIRALGIEVVRVAGDTRYATSVRVVEVALDRDLGSLRTSLWFATGANIPDSLAAGPAVAATGSVLVLTPTSGLDPATTAFLAAREERPRLQLAGGPAAIDDQVVCDVLGAWRS